MAWPQDVSEKKIAPVASIQHSDVPVTVLFEQGLSAHKQGHLLQAKELYVAVLNTNAQHFDALHMMGVVELSLGHLLDAANLMQKALIANPNSEEAHYNLGLALDGLNEKAKAIESYDKCLKINPKNFKALNNKSKSLRDLGQFDEAISSSSMAIALKPDYAEAYLNRGTALTAFKKFDSALASYDKAISLKPDFAEAYSNRGTALTALKKFDSAVASCEKAIILKPDSVEAHTNKGNALLALKKFDLALDSYDQAINIKPDHVGPHWNKSLAYLLLGQFTEGWKLYEWRWKNEDQGSKLRNFSQPLWLGSESLANKTILLHCEQGLGDTVQFCRYAKLVKVLGARVVMEVPAPMLTLLQSLEGVDQLVEQGQPLPDYDCHCPLLSLPLAFKTDLSSIPSPEPYLRSDSVKVAQWQTKLGDKTKPRIGLVWSGRREHGNDHNRSIALHDLMSHLPSGFDYVALQQEIREADQEALNTSCIQYFGQDLKNYADTAALCELMDLVICVDTSVAHLAAALGKPTWVLLPYVPDWRWLLDRDDSPWYGCVRLFRQQEDRSWPAVLDKLGQSLLKDKKLPQFVKEEAQLLLAPKELSNLGFENDWVKQFERGLALHKQGRLERAKEIYQKVINANPRHFDALHMLGVIALTSKDPELACSLIQNALLLDPSSADAHFNFGLAAHANGQPFSAIESYDQAIAINPQDSKLYWNKSLSLLLSGQFDEGWRLYEYGWHGSQQRGAERKGPKPLWLGSESLANKTILLHCEQGLGDTLQFCRYAKLVKALGARVVMEVPAPMLPLLQSLEGVDQLVEQGQPLPDYDCHCPLLSLPLAFKTDLSSIPRPEPYLRSDSVKVAQWQTKLGDKTKPRIGLVWSGRREHGNDHNRSIALHDLMSHLPGGFDYVALQQEIREVDQEALQQSSIQYFGDELKDFADTAALCELMDLVICVDTSVAHLAAALGKPTWVLLPYVPDWRWLLDREDSPWYGSVKLYRQASDRTWSPVLQRVSLSLLSQAKPPVANSLGVQQITKKFMAGLTAFQNSQPVQAKSILEDLLHDAPNHFDAVHLYGIVLGQLQETKKSIEIFKRAIEIQPNNADLHSNLGNAYKNDGKHELAITHCEMAIRLNANHANAYTNRAIALQQLERLDEALVSFDKAIALNPNEHKNYLNKGVIHRKLKNYDEALKSFEKTIELKRDCAEAYSNRGVVLKEIKRFDEELASYDKAISIKTDYAEVYINRGNVLQELKRFDEALASYDKAISIKTDHAGTYFNKSLALLLRGEFGDGWRLYEWRWKYEGLDSKLPDFSQPLWLGVESLQGQTILLHSEQGFGDTIQFCRYAKQVKALGARLVMEIPTALLPLLQSLEGVDELMAKGQALPAFDYHCPLLSLPLAFKTELSTIPSPEPYLCSDSVKVAQWQTKLGDKTKPRIGLVWSGRREHGNDHNRSIALHDLMSHLPSGFDYVALQQEIRDADQEALNTSCIQYFGQDLKNYADTAALCELMDLVICVDTSVAHLAAALGKPTWVLLPFVPDWRWLLDREDSPWYGSVKLYRQDDERIWSSVLKRVATDLRLLS